ncbi:hypothetical protein GCM10010924_49540 [Rhizobium wenxiniae]|nr:hypothetical protein GCM10010924_49540 [Rhizobium wenxiniae]
METTELTVYAVYPTRKLLPLKVRWVLDSLTDVFWDHAETASSFTRSDSGSHPKG